MTEQIYHSAAASATPSPSDGPAGYTLSPIFYINIFPAQVEDYDDNIAYFDYLRDNTTIYPYIGNGGTGPDGLPRGATSVDSIDKAYQFAIVNAETQGYLTRIDPETGKPDGYFSAPSKNLNFYKQASLKFSSDFSDLGKGDPVDDVYTKFSIQYDFDSPLFPYARTLQFTNINFQNCGGSNAFFCTTRSGASFTPYRDVEAYYGISPRASCGDVYLVPECVTPNCFVKDSFCSVRRSAAASSVSATAMASAR